MNPKKVLLAEDDLDDQFLFTDFLNHRADVVLMPMAENGEMLLEYLQALTDDALPDVIVLDHNMPKRNGLQTLTILKEDKRYAHIPVMIYSTYIDENLVKKGSECGAAEIITKPVTKKGYEDMLNKFLEFVK